jgi:hypothetical protein
MEVGPKRNVTGRPLEELAEELSRRGCRAEVYEGTLVVSSGARGEWAAFALGRIVRWA